MIRITYTTFTPAGSEQRTMEIDEVSYMDIRTNDRGESILHVWTDEDEDELVAVFRVWDYAVRIFEDEDEPKDPAEVPEDNVIHFPGVGGTSASMPAIVDEWTEVVG